MQMNISLINDKSVANVAIQVPAESSQGGGDKDSESACSGCTDSGRGLSEEGDSCHVFGPGSMPPKCPPVRETKSEFLGLSF